MVGGGARRESSKQAHEVAVNIYYLQECILKHALTKSSTVAL
jgi:hypothetical protein